MIVDIFKTAVEIVMCHLIGDYVLQIDFISKSKGDNWYHMFVHCVLYCVPFAVVFGIDWKLAILFVSHIIIDPLKAKYHKISYAQDQVFHYVIAEVLYLIL